MSAAPLLPPAPPINKRFTRADIDRLERAGAFEGHRYELIDGELIDKMGQNPPHASTIRRITSVLAKFFDIKLIQIQSPIEVSGEDRQRSLPEPDVLVLREDNPAYDERYPRGDEVLLVVEVSDSTVASDLTRKAALYARAGVPEYWVFDIGGRRILAHRQPEGSAYAVRVNFTDGEEISLERGSERIPVVDLLPPAR